MKASGVWRYVFLIKSLCDAVHCRSHRARAGARHVGGPSGLITLVNTQNASITKIDYSCSIQRAETKYGLRIHFLALVVIKDGVMRKIVTWEGIHVSALRSQIMDQSIPDGE